MTLDQLRGEMRELIGNVTVNEVSDRQLDSYLVASLTWLAAELKFDIITDESVGLTADVAEYPIPSDALFWVWVEYNDQRLEPVSPYLLDREGNWRTTSSGTPTRYAIQGRTMIINPAPDSTSITTDSTLSWRYVGSGMKMPATGPQGLSDLDQQLLRYDAAVGWLSSRPTDENNARIQAYSAFIARRLPAAKRQHEEPQETNYPQIAVKTYRFGGSR